MPEAITPYDLPNSAKQQLLTLAAERKSCWREARTLTQWGMPKGQL